MDGDVTFADIDTWITDIVWGTHSALAAACVSAMLKHGSFELVTLCHVVHAPACTIEHALNDLRDDDIVECVRERWQSDRRRVVRCIYKSGSLRLCRS